MCREESEGAVSTSGGKVVEHVTTWVGGGG